MSLKKEKQKKQKVWTYSPSSSCDFIRKDGSLQKNIMNSELYQIGIYVIINNDPSMQTTCTPEKMEKIQKQCVKDEAKGIIKNLVLSTPIKVTQDENGFYIQIS